MEIVGLRVSWKKYLYLFFLLLFACVDAWLIYSISQAKKIDSFLLIMMIVVSIVDILLLVMTIIKFSRKKDAIKVSDNDVILENSKLNKIKFDDIKNIQYRQYKSGDKLGFKYKSGDIIFTLSDDKKVKVNDIKYVIEVCETLRNKILKGEEINGKN
jgi:hypothetical protein